MQYLIEILRVKGCTENGNNVYMLFKNMLFIESTHFYYNKCFDTEDNQRHNIIFYYFRFPYFLYMLKVKIKKKRK